MTPRPGDIGLVRITGPVGWAVQLGEFLWDGAWRVSHAFVYLDEETDSVMEAEPGGARITSLAAYADRTIFWLSPVGLTDGQRLAITVWARRQVGVPYGWRDYAALLLWRLRVRLPAVRRWIECTDTLICSQLADLAYMKAGVHLFDDGRQSGFVTPGDLDRLRRKIKLSPCVK